MIAGWPNQNGGQSIDSMGVSLSNPNHGCEYLISDAIYTHTPGESGNLIKPAPSLAAIRAWMVDQGKCWMGTHDIWMSLPKLRPRRRIHG